MEQIQTEAVMKPSNIWVKTGIATLFIGAVIGFFLLGGDQYLTLETIKENRDTLLSYTETHFALAILIAFIVYTLSTAFSLPGAAVLSLTVGFLFGRWIGTVVILLSATLGATMVFIAARYLFADAARKRLSSSKAAKLLNGFNENAFNYLLFLRLVPLFPFWLVNLAPAFTPIKLRTYIVGTAIGILPGCFVFANLGQSLGRIESLDQLLSVETILALGLLGLFALIPIIIKKLKKQRSA